MDLRSALLDALLKADARVFTSLQPGTAVTKVVNDPQQIMSLLGGTVVSILRDGLPALAMLGYLFYLNWQLTLLSLVTTPVMAVVVRRVNQRVQKMGTRTYDAQLHLVNKVDDVTRAWRVVRSFDAAEHERMRFAERAREVQRNFVKTGRRRRADPAAVAVDRQHRPVPHHLPGPAAGPRQQQTGVGEFAAFVTALLLLTSRLRHLSDLAQPITNAMVVARGCLGLMDMPTEPDTGTQELRQCRRRDRDAGRQPALPRRRTPGAGRPEPRLQGRPDDRPGRFIGCGQELHHPSAAGLRPTRRRVGSCSTASTSRRSKKANLRRQFAVVSQDIVLFDASVADNIAYAQPRDAARLEQALRAAHLWDFVQGLPQGVDTPVGANGSKLSGGQRQRLAIARALYKDAPIWVFDEATSALDTESERAVQQALEQWQGRKTLIVIAHRLSTVRTCRHHPCARRRAGAGKRLARRAAGAPTARTPRWCGHKTASRAMQRRGLL